MPVHCEEIAGKWRIINESGQVEEVDNGTPRDGGGHDTKTECEQQASAINGRTEATARMRMIDTGAGRRP